MPGFKYNKVCKYRILASTVSPLHIGGFAGGTDEILTDSISENPFIQATGIAGFLRSACENICGTDVTNDLFGADRIEEGRNSNDFRSRVKVSDGRFASDTVKLELRPGVAIDRKTGTATGIDISGQKYETLYISAGAVVEFYVYLFTKDENEENNLESVFGVLAGNDSQLGAKKSSGAGKIIANRIEKAAFDLTNEDERKAWRDEGRNEIDYVDITSRIRSKSLGVKYEITLKGTTEGPILIKGLSTDEFGGKAPDTINIRNGKGEYIVPGTSIRGAIRSQMEMISKYMGKEELIKSSFGFMATNHSNSHSGNLIFSDSLIGSIKDNDTNPVRSRIHIDKFTGGVMSQALFHEKNAAGDITIRIKILDKYNPDATLGLLIFALRDLAIKSYNLGSGYATGKGFIDCSTISVRCGDKESEVNIKEGQKAIIDNDGLIQKALAALKEA